MAILNFNEPKNAFEYSPQANLKELALGIEKNLFGDAGFHIVKNFIDPAMADRIRDFYVKENASAFRSERSPLFTFHGQSLIIYFPKSPFPIPDFMMSAYERISLLRNMVYENQRFYRDYCTTYKLNPHDHKRVYDHQIKHTWMRVSWYRDHDGQCPHKDNYGEIAAFILLSKKGVHWQKGGLCIYDQDGNRTIDVDALCNPGDVLWLDQNKVIHVVEPILGSDPGRLLIYIPIIPSGYMQPWYTFEGHPNEVYFTRDLPLLSRWGAHVQNAWNNLTGKNKIHYSRRQHPHTTLLLRSASRVDRIPELIAAR